MRNLTAAALLLTVLCPSVALAAPEALRCKAKYDPTKVDANPESPGFNVNCFAGEVFILDGAQVVTIPGDVPFQRGLVECADKSGLPGVKDSRNCFVGTIDAQLSGGALKPAVNKVLDLLRAKVPNLPNWDEMLFFRANFARSFETGPLFFREQTDDTRAPIFEASNLGRPLVPRDKPYVGIIDAGNTAAMGEKPGEDLYLPCGDPQFFPLPSDYPDATICPPGLFTYYDALAQTTASLYGPYLSVPATHGGPMTSLPALKGPLAVGFNAMGAATSIYEDRGLEMRIWNSLLDLPGSLLGGNTFRPNGNDTFGVGMPTPFEGVSAPFAGAQRPRFHPLDLYVLGLLPWQEVPAIRSFISAKVDDVAEPKGLTSLYSGLGPAMGTRIDGVAIKRRETVASTGVIPVLPKSIPVVDIVQASGGERDPGYATAPQFIRQLWVVITKPMFAIEAAATDLSSSDPALRPEKLEDELKAQRDQVLAVQKARRDYARYYYALTSYRGRVYTTFEGDVDDNAYWEFGGARDDAKIFTATGGLDMALVQEPIPNTGGKVLTVLRVNQTPGDAGKIVLAPQNGHRIRIDGDQTGNTPNNVLTIRMRVPRDQALLDALRANPGHEGGFFATVTLQGGPADVSFRVPSNPNAYLVPDGNFRNYSVLLNLEKKAEDPSMDNAFVKGGSWTTLTVTPSNRPAQMEIDFIRLGFADNAKDADLSCDGKTPQPDGWPDAEDNCPTVPNPTQEDGNGDGIGDACEDFDGDRAPNQCDNCPLLSNSSQRDRDRNGKGDACDPESTESCWGPDAIGGKVRNPSAFALFAVALLGLVAIRRRTRRPRR